jgi:hypothetical protein
VVVSSNERMNDLGKILIGFGLLLLIAGAVVLILGRFNLPIGRLPGDLSWRNRTGTTQVYFPVVTCIVLSVVLTLLMWLINHFRR